MPSSSDGGALCVPADLASVRELAAHLRAACQDAAIDTRIVFELELALVEAANNIVTHGYGGDCEGTIALSIAVDDCTVTLTLSDTGRPIPSDFFANASLPDAEATHGRGIAIIQACSDSLSYESRNGRNCLVLTRTIPASP